MQEAAPRSVRAKQSSDGSHAAGQMLEPVWFGDDARPLFGFYHPPSRDNARTAVVLCNPFGHEAMSSHRAYLALASRLANAGFPTLRFDYDGTGDSAGGAQDPERVAAWLRSIAAARDFVLAQSGLDQVVLVGTRLGALLALRHATERPVDGLVLFAPPASGRAWVREMRALQLVRDGGQERESAVMGFPLSEETANEIAQISIKSITRVPSKFALLVPRDDLGTGESELARHLHSLGVETTTTAAPGYAALMHDDPIKALAPEQVFEAIVAWLRATFEPGSKRGAELAPSSESARRGNGAGKTASATALPEPGVREEALLFQGLFGILNTPAVPGSRAQTAVVFFNIGANHHVGNNRMYVTLGRQLARQGFSALRMDFSGIGDSYAPRGVRENDVYAKRFFGEARTAIDFLQARGVKHFVLVGLCSGAYVAYHTAVADPRVKGIVLINLLTFYWQEGDSLEIRTRNSTKSTLFYRKALLKPSTWLRVARRGVNTRVVARALFQRAALRVRREAAKVSARITGSVAEATDVGRGFMALDARQVRALLVYGSHDGGIDVIEEHLGPGAHDMRRSTSFRMQIVEGPDHTFTPLWTQLHLYELVVAHVEACHAALEASDDRS